jgi:hypothetical protein
VFNADMAIETVIEHPKKSQLTGITAKVRQMLTAVATAAELLQPTEPSLDKRTGQVSGIMNHAEAACRSLDTAKLIASASTSILVYGEKQGGQSMSKEVLDIDAGETYKGAKIPASLRRLLEGVRDGDTSVLDGIYSYQPRASHSKSGGKQNKKRKRDRRSGDEATCEKASPMAEVPGGVSPGGGAKAELDDAGAEAEGQGCSAPASPCEGSRASAPSGLQHLQGFSVKRPPSIWTWTVFERCHCLRCESKMGGARDLCAIHCCNFVRIRSGAAGGDGVCSFFVRMCHVVIVRCYGVDVLYLLLDVKICLFVVSRS